MAEYERKRGMYMPKKILALAAALVLFVILSAVKNLPAQAEETLSPLGDWYAEIGGLPLQLTLTEDGTYTLSFPGLPEEPSKGAWELNDGFILLDGDDTAPFSWDGDRLTRRSLGLFFTREMPALYTPAEVLPDAALEQFAGAWRGAYAVLDGAALPASALGDDTILYIEENAVALTGNLFGEIIAEFVYDNGALSFASDGLSITLQLQQDGFLRMTLSAGDEELTLALGSYVPEGLMQEGD